MLSPAVCCLRKCFSRRGLRYTEPRIGLSALLPWECVDMMTGDASLFLLRLSSPFWVVSLIDAAGDSGE